MFLVKSLLIWRRCLYQELTVSQSSQPLWFIELPVLNKSLLCSGLKLSTVWIPVSNPCGLEVNGGCSHLCLPNGVATYQCACPSFSGLVLGDDSLTCIGKLLPQIFYDSTVSETSHWFYSIISEPKEILLFSDSQSGFVGFVDAKRIGSENADISLIGYSKRPVGVAYDPIEKVIGCHFFMKTDWKSTICVILIAKGKQDPHVLKLKSNSNLWNNSRMYIGVMWRRGSFIGQTSEVERRKFFLEEMLDWDMWMVSMEPAFRMVPLPISSSLLAQLASGV